MTSITRNLYISNANTLLVFFVKSSKMAILFIRYNYKYVEIFFVGLNIDGNNFTNFIRTICNFIT